MRCKYCGFPTKKKKNGSEIYRTTCDRKECFQIRRQQDYLKIRAKRIIQNRKKWLE